jgi:hypothetical protein
VPAADCYSLFPGAVAAFWAGTCTLDLGGTGGGMGDLLEVARCHVMGALAFSLVLGGSDGAGFGAEVDDSPPAASSVCECTTTEVGIDRVSS